MIAEARMSEAREARLWQILGWAFVIGGAVPLAVDMLIFTRTLRVDAEALKVGVWCSFMILVGITALAACRMVAALHGKVESEDPGAWTLLAFGGMPVGALLFQIEWLRTMTLPTTTNQKAVLLAGAFVFLAGLIAMAADRVVRHAEKVSRQRANNAAQMMRIG